GSRPENAGALSSDINGKQEWSNVYSYTVVQVRIPAGWLALQGLPTHEDVVRRLAIKDLLQLGLERSSRNESRLASCVVPRHSTLCAEDPITQIAKRESFKVGLGQRVIVH